MLPFVIVALFLTRAVLGFPLAMDKYERPETSRIHNSWPEHTSKNFLRKASPAGINEMNDDFEYNGMDKVRIGTEQGKLEHSTVVSTIHPKPIRRKAMAFLPEFDDEGKLIVQSETVHGWKFNGQIPRIEPSPEAYQHKYKKFQ